MNQQHTTRTTQPRQSAHIAPCIPAAKPQDARESAERPPAGYRLVEDGRHQIGLRDLVFVGGRNATWRAARRAGELGNIRRDSAALAVAVLMN
jgi:hypothetical protein